MRGNVIVGIHIRDVIIINMIITNGSPFRLAVDINANAQTNVYLGINYLG
jgi:hypothetical protein